MAANYFETKQDFDLKHQNEILEEQNAMLVTKLDAAEEANAMEIENHQIKENQLKQ